MLRIFLFLILFTATAAFGAQKAFEEPAIVVYQKGKLAMQNGHYNDAQILFRSLYLKHPQTAFAPKAIFLSAVCLFELGEYEQCLQRLKGYLKHKDSVKCFEEAIRYKLGCAEAIAQGERLHLFGAHSMPMVIQSRSMALDVYDEVVDALPQHPLAAQALMSKAALLTAKKRYTEAIETLMQFIKRFPKEERVGAAFLAISKAYADENEREKNNPDLLPLAQLHLKKFEKMLPASPLLTEAKKHYARMEETQGRNLYETGLFYERVKHPEASVIYYISTMKDFPNTKAAQDAKVRLEHHKNLYEELKFEERRV